MAKKSTRKKTSSKARKSTTKRKSSKTAKSGAPKLKAMAGKPASIIIVAPQKKHVGKIVHYYGKINVGIVKVTGYDLVAGDEISIEGAHTKISQKVSTMQLEHKPVSVARKGQTVGIKVSGRVRRNDAVYKIVKQL